MRDSSNAVEQEGMILHLADGSIQACNHHAQRILGVSTSQIQQWISLESPWQAIASDGSPLLRDMHPATVALSTGKPCLNIIMGVCQSNCAVIWLEVNSQPLFQGDETTPYAVVTTFFDITHQKLKQGTLTVFDQLSAQNLERSIVEKIVERFTLAAKAVNCLIYDWDLESNTVERIYGLTEILGYQLEEAEPTAQWWYDRIHPEDLPKTNEQDFWQHIAQNNRFCTEYRIRHKDGHYLWVQDRQIIIKDSSGKPTRIVGSTTDISERQAAIRDRQQTKAELNANMAILNAINEATTNLIFVKDRLGRMLMGNPATIQLLGQPEAKILGHTDVELLDDRLGAEQIRLNDRQVMETGQVGVFEETVECPEGIRTYLSTKSPYRDDQGKIIGLIGVSTDITERKQAEIKLRESEERLRLATVGGELGMWFWDLPPNELVWTDKCKELFGVAADVQMTYEVFLQSLHPDDRDRTHEAVIRAQEGREDYDIEYRTVWSDGSVHWIAAKARCFHDADGKMVKMMGTAQDITARKQAEEALRRSEEFNRRILESSSDCIKLLDVNGLLLYMNEGGMCLMEIEDLTPLLNTNWLDCWQGEEHQAARTALAAALDGELGRFQGYCPTFQQTPKWWDVVITPIRDAAGQIVQLLVVSRDITEQQAIIRERESLLQQEQMARSAAEQANRVKDEFLAVLSHELRSPINPILGWAQMMQTYELDAAQTNQALITIERNARLLTQLIDDLLDIARILRGKLALKVAPLNLNLVLEAAMETVQTAALAKSIVLKKHVSPVGQVRGDFGRLQQIIWNLLTNAVKFTPHGGHVEIQLQQVGDHAQLSISDNGKGIAPEFLPHVFEYFRQADASVTRNHGGLGLGLAIVHYLVELHGGEVTVTSPGLGQGATFTVQLPLLKVNSQDAANNKGEIEHDANPLNLEGIKVLVIDDDLDNREFLTLMLQHYQAEVIAVASAPEVSSALKTFKPDILVSDIGMPGIDGYTLMRSIRRLPPEQGGEIPAIAVTAYARAEDRLQALASGFQRHLSKPIEANELVTIITELVVGIR